MIRGDKGEKEAKGNKEKSVYSSISTPKRMEAEPHNKKGKGDKGG